MRREFAVVLLVFLSAPFAAGQQVAPSAPPPGANAQTAQPTVYYYGPGVIAPKLLHMTLKDAPKGACKELHGTSVYSTVVGTDGIAHDPRLVLSAQNLIDRLALNLVNSDRFEPGEADGAPAPVSVLIEVSASACIEESANAEGKAVQSLSVKSLPKQTLEVEPSPHPSTESATYIDGPDTVPFSANSSAYSHITPPVVEHLATAQYSDGPWRDKIGGVCIVSLIVDEKGMLQNVHVVRSLTPSLDRNAIEAVRQYRFKPAMKDGKPVSLPINIEIVFRLD